MQPPTFVSSLLIGPKGYTPLNLYDINPMYPDNANIFCDNAFSQILSLCQWIFLDHYACQIYFKYVNLVGAFRVQTVSLNSAKNNLEYFNYLNTASTHVSDSVGLIFLRQLSTATVVPPIYIGRKISTSKGQNRLANVKNLTTLDIVWHDLESTFQQNKNNLFKYTENGEKIFSCQPTNIVEVWYEHRTDLHTGIKNSIQFLQISA